MGHNIKIKNIIFALLGEIRLFARLCYEYIIYVNQLQVFTNLKVRLVLNPLLMVELGLK